MPMRKITLYIPADDDTIRDILKDLLEYSRTLMTERITGPIRLEHDEDIHIA
jgi:hypothetical protein